jgi:integrase
LALVDALPEYLRDPVSFLYHAGWRVSEMRKIEWKHMDGDTLVLPPELAKNKTGRRLPLTGELGEIIERARKRRRLDQPRIFHNDGTAIGDFRKAWQRACVRVGRGQWIQEKKIPGVKRGRKKYLGLIVHDLRRSCVRNLIRSGLSEKIAMDQSGHKTRAIFERYNIVDDTDRQVAQRRYQAWLLEQKNEAVAVAAMAKAK